MSNNKELDEAVCRLGALALKQSNDAILEVVAAENRLIAYIDKLTDAAMENQLQSREVMRNAICNVVMEIDDE